MMDESRDSISRKEKIEEHFDTLDDEEFARRFRLTKLTVWSVLETIEDKLKVPTEINHGVTPINQLLCALRYYATGCYITAGTNFYISASTAQSIVQTVSVAIAIVRSQYMHFPESADEIHQTQKSFYKIARFPIVIGAIGCTHVKYIKSGQLDPLFGTRKTIIHLIFKPSVMPAWNLLTLLHDGLGVQKTHRSSTIVIENQCLKRGNMGLDWMEICITDAEILYNACHLKTWNSVKKLFELWKRRFPSMAIGLGDTVQHSLPIIIATTVLHNIAVKNNEGTPPNDNQVVAPASWDELLAQGFM